ncbi:MAG: hypothetical protein JWQ11_3488 [Rhizobacter sp.]|nr:hypothetical protein [Rhizobacter sp.]
MNTTPTNEREVLLLDMVHAAGYFMSDKLALLSAAVRDHAEDALRIGGSVDIQIRAAVGTCCVRIILCHVDGRVEVLREDIVVR